MSSSLFIMEHSDFSIDDETPPRLCIEAPDFFMVLYYSNNCKFCGSVIDIFKKLAVHMNGNIKFGIINIDQHKAVVRASKKTTTAIEYVPLVIMYQNGAPYRLYEGDGADIVPFIQETIAKWHNDNEVVAKTGGALPLPPYLLCAANPGKNVCFLTIDEAYDAESSKGIPESNIGELRHRPARQQHMPKQKGPATIATPVRERFGQQQQQRQQMFSRGMGTGVFEQNQRFDNRGMMRR